jgi:hypothetical protein
MMMEINMGNVSNESRRMFISKDLKPGMVVKINRVKYTEPTCGLVPPMLDKIGNEEKIRSENGLSEDLNGNVFTQIRLENGWLWDIRDLSFFVDQPTKKQKQQTFKFDVDDLTL